jgi:hypothetical protein
MSGPFFTPRPTVGAPNLAATSYSSGYRSQTVWTKCQRVRSKCRTLWCVWRVVLVPLALRPKDETVTVAAR